MYGLFFLLTGLVFAKDPFVSSYFVREAMSPLDTHARMEDLSAESCAGCHQQEFSDWSKSRHRISYTNQNFFEGHIREKQDRCLHCHAPLKEQLLEIKTSPVLKLAHEGVNCTACHIRDGKVFGSSFHGTTKSDFLKSPRFCAGCHEFDINGVSGGKIHLTEVNAQNTYSQWVAYKNAGGTKTCQQCHMPEGRHLFHGAHAGNKTPLEVSTPRKGVLRIQLKDIGHHYPSGDVFRRVTLEVKRGKKFEMIRSFTRKYVLENDFRLASDTTLKPFEIVDVDIQGKLPIQYRFVYHFLKDTEKKFSQIPKEHQERVVLEGWLR